MRYCDLKHGQLLVADNDQNCMWVSIMIGGKHYIPNFFNGDGGDGGVLHVATTGEIPRSQLVLPTIQEIVRIARSKCK